MSSTTTTAAPRSWDHWIGGRRHAAVTGETLESTDPRSGTVVATIAAGDAADVDAAVRTAAAAQPAWARLAPAARSRHLHEVAAAVRAAAGAIAEAEVAETGKPLGLARIEADGVADYLEYYAGVLRAVQGAVIDIGPDQRILSQRVPFGVIGVITPWNAPVYSAIRGVAPSLAAGNAVVVKPSEFTSTTTLLLAEVASSAGLPDGVLNVVTGVGATAGAALVEHPLVGKVSFTGSVAAGRVIGRAAAERLIPLVLELGGKSPNIVFADADLDEAADAAVGGFTMNSGQVCAAGTRILVERSAYDGFVARVEERLRARRSDELGPIITGPQFDRVREYLRIGLAGGARIAGEQPADAASERQRIDPVLFVDADNDMRIAREEIFGPVAVAIPFESEEDAVRLANDSEYGLVSAVWTRDIDRAFRVADRLETGQVFVNQFGTLDVETPFGGMKHSGYGREKGLEALHEFTRVKSIMIKVRA